MPTFPSSPTTDQEYTENGVTYIFTGSKWKPVTKPYSMVGESVTESGGSVSIDLSKGNFFEVDYGANTTITFDNPPDEITSFRVLLKSPTIAGFDLTTAAYKTMSPQTFTANPTSIVFGPNGDNYYILTSTNDTIYQYALSIPWDITSTRTTIGDVSVATQAPDPRGMFIRPDGLKLYVLDAVNNDTVYEYNLATAWKISTASYSSKSFYIGTQEPNPYSSPHFSTDGTYMYIMGNANQRIWQYQLSTAWDVSTAIYINKSYNTTEEIYPRCIQFQSDGLSFFLVGTNTDRVYKYTLTTAWDISTASYTGISFYVGTQEGVPQGLFFKPDGTHMYITGNNNRIYQYSTATNQYTVTWPTNITWEESAAPGILDSNGKITIDFHTIDGGTTYYAEIPERNIQ